MNHLRRAAILAVTPVLGLVSAAPALATTEPASAPVDLSGVTLRVGDQVNITQSALESAGLVDTPYTIEWASFTSGPPLLEALNAGAIDVGGVGDTPPIFAASSGATIKLVLATATPPTNHGILVQADSDIASIADLAGHSIAVAQGSSHHWVLLKALQDAGLTVDDVTINFLQPAEALAAFQGGDVDAWSIWDPFSQLARDQGAVLLTSAADLGLRGVGFQVSSDAALADPAVAAAIGDFLERLRAAQAWQREHKDDWAETYAGLTGLEVELVQKLLLVETEPLLLDDEVVADVQEAADAFFTAGLIPSAVDVASIVDDRFNDIALNGAEITDATDTTDATVTTAP